MKKRLQSFKENSVFFIYEKWSRRAKDLGWKRRLIAVYVPVEFLKVSSPILISCLPSTSVYTGPAFHRWNIRSFAHTMLYTTEAWSPISHPKQILIGHSRLHNRDIPSAAIAWGKVPNDVLFGQFSPPMLISSPCWLPSKTNHFYREQRYQMSRKLPICVDPRTTRGFLGQKLSFFQ